MYLVIAEKPSVSQAIAKVIGAYKRKEGYLEGRDCLVSWCLGHLAEYAPPESYDSRYRFWQYKDLPIIPDVWKLLVSEDKKEQFGVLKELLNRSDVEYVVNACDAGREGELIFRRVYELSGSHIPMKRLWISSMEDKAIEEGFSNLRDGELYDHLCQASVCRAQADWLIGMNATRAFTTTYGKKLTVGRVQSPTLAMLVERQNQMEQFQKEDALEVLDIIHSWQKKMMDQYGIHFIHASDEWYILAGKDLPLEESYDGYLQLENGVGMLRLLGEEVKEAVAGRTGDDRRIKAVSATGALAAPFIKKYMEMIHEKFPNVEVDVISIRNEFFGETITVSGLITGQDLIRQLSGRDLGEKLLLPCNMLKNEEDVFLDDISVEELSRKLNVEIVIVDEGGSDLVSAVLDPIEHKKQKRRQMYEQTGSSNCGQA